jgi:hypothetical protein
MSLNDTRRPRLRVLGAAHVIVGLLLLPLSTAFGLLVAPILILGPLWIVVLGVLLWRSSVRVVTLARRTHTVGVVIAVLLFLHGIMALQAAARSAAEGGGLLGTYGLIPIGYGLLLGLFSVVSLILMRSNETRDRK